MMTIVKDDAGEFLYYECKFCGYDNGNFNTRTGNHVHCDKIDKLERTIKKLQKFRAILACDASAISYQTMGQYRWMLLKEFDKALA